MGSARRPKPTSPYGANTKSFAPDTLRAASSSSPETMTTGTSFERTTTAAGKTP
jgi:hypothetical protein